MASLKGLASLVSELRVERTNLANQLRHVDAALSVLGKLGGGEYLRKAEAHSVSLGSQADEPRAESTMGKEQKQGTSGQDETQAHHVSISP
jgi:hypothetical protein